ncbi:ABC transporter permease [bacterium]|nr:ABC transporter permease [bacterium]
MELDEVAVEFMGNFNTPDGSEVSETLISAYMAATAQGEDAFELDGTLYKVISDKKENAIYAENTVALALLNIFDVYAEENTNDVLGYDFKYASSMALYQGESSFEVNSQTYTIESNKAGSTIYDSNGEPYAEVSMIIVNPVDQSIFLPVEFKSEARKAIVNLETEFASIDSTGELIDFDIHRMNANYYIRKMTETEVINMYEDPSSIHWLGTDNNGMDVITRLMYGGRVSLMVGFVVIIIEVAIGIVVGGISGFFGGAVDTALMRFVDLFNSIPFYPIVLIFGSVMDTMNVNPLYRIFLLMLVLGLLGWTGVARVVRGQILTLREQDFMVATEATGIRTSRRIFRHLIPNVMPLLIVNATAGLGGIIITEATLGFLGLGVKYPLASWGSIINTASDAFVMTNYWFMWIPAGSLILLTVLGFNFVGDGLRDAYDPKMNR